jgi:hypothetical protein
MRMRRQAGEGVMGCVVWLLILAAIGLVLIKVLPVKIASAELADFMVEQAKFAGRGTTAAGVQQAIYDKAVALDLPVAKKDIVVRLTGGRIMMKCTYSVPIDLVVYTYVWEFKHEENRPVFII